MRILVANKLFWPDQRGGAEVSVRNLVRGFVAAGHQVAVVCLSEKPGRDVVDGASVFRLPIRNVHWPYGPRRRGALRRILWHAIDLYNPLAGRDMARVLREFGPDLLFTNNLSGLSVACWKAASMQNVPIVHTSRDYYLLHPNSTLFKKGRNQSPDILLAKSTAWVKRRASRQVSAYVGISQFIADIHLDAGFFSRARACVIYNSLEASLPERGTSCREKESRHVVGYIGRIDPTKGLEVLLEALRSLGRPYRLVVAGEGEPEYVARLKMAAADLDVKWLGRVAPATLFGQVDMTVVPSLWREPLGRVVLESYSFGVPVVGARSGGIPEIIRDGQTGFSYASTDSASLADAVRRCAAMDTGQVRKACFAYMSRFSEQEIAGQYLALFRSVLDSDGQPGCTAERARDVGSSA